MITLRTLITTVVIAMSLSFMSGHASAEANFDSVLVYQPQAKWIDSEGTLSWKTKVVNGTNDTAYYHVYLRILDSAGFELTYTDRIMEKLGPRSVKDHEGTFVVQPKYLNQFGSVEIGIEKDDDSTWMAEAKRKVAPQQVTAKPPAEQPKWVQPKIYPGVKLYYSHDGMKMRYIGTIFDAVSRTIDGERCFGITMASGSKEYKQRAILWNGYWFMDQVQGQKAIDKFMEQ